MQEFYVKNSNIIGSGLYITQSVKKHKTVGYIHGEIHVFRKLTKEISLMMLNWIGIGRFSWIDTTKSPFRFINHSCNPNVAIVTKRKVVALRDIEANEEITMDYSLTEAEPNWQIECICKNKRCRHKIGPIGSLPLKTYKEYLPYIPKNFQKIYNTSKI